MPGLEGHRSCKSSGLPEPYDKFVIVVFVHISLLCKLVETHVGDGDEVSRKCASSIFDKVTQDILFARFLVLEN